jgi:hypothetical protein
MARVTHVKKAQQRYATVPVLDAEGKPVRTPVIGRNGEQKKNKHGRPTYMTKTVADKSRPLPNYTCGKCGVEIKPGDPYKWIKPKSGPYGGRLMVRCGSCPAWQVWEYSSSLSARTAQISHDFERAIDGATGPDEITSALEDAANSAREIAEEKRESAQNIEDGFGHPTSSSEELNEIADSLDSWADEIEQADVPDLDDYPCDDCSGEGEVECQECDGSGEVEDETGDSVTCEDCSGDGKVECENGSCEEGKDIEAWLDEVRSNCSIVDECPV